MEIYSISSGSSGNCICVGSDDTHVLIDAGVSGKKIEAGLNAIDLATADMEGILITHEHADHIAGLGVVARRYGIPMYATRGTIDAVISSPSIGDVDEGLFCEIHSGEPFPIGDLTALPISVSHDAADPVAYEISCDGKSVAVITDLGVYDEEIVDRIQNQDVLMLEANYDVHMLEAGRYPYPLKQRIFGERGHLSNDLCGKLLCEAVHDRLKAVVLGHLSKENNYAELAYETVRLALSMADNPYHGDDFPMYVAKRDMPSARVVF